MYIRQIKHGVSRQRQYTGCERNTHGADSNPWYHHREGYIGTRTFRVFLDPFDTTQGK